MTKPSQPYIMTSGHPHLRVFHPHHGHWELALSNGEQCLGSASDAELSIPGPDIAPMQLKLNLQGERLEFENLAPEHEVLLNCSNSWQKHLGPGDTMSIGKYRFSFSVLRKSPVNKKQKFVTQFSFLPAQIKLRYRPVDLPQDFLGQHAHTLHIRHGGILIPTWVEPPNEPPLGTMEIELRLPRKGRRMAFGQVHENILHKERFMMMVQVYQTDRQSYEQSMLHAFRADWITPAPHKIPKLISTSNGTNTAS